MPVTNAPLKPLYPFPAPEDIGRLAQKALLAEAEAAPKPGLVDRLDPGAHTDMDITTFRASAAALEPYFAGFARMGLESRALPLKGRMDALRPYGMEAERAMYAATGGVNTHKGAIFSLGILSFLAGRTLCAGAAAAPEELCGMASVLTEGITGELKALPVTARDAFAGEGRPSAAQRPPATKGELAYQKYGAGGVRAQAEQGFPAVRQTALPAYRSALAAGASENDAVLWVLLTLMARVEDTNVLMRCGWEPARYAAGEAERLLARFRPGDRELLTRLAALNRVFIQKRISHGGCADLTALTVFLYHACAGAG